MNQSTFNLLISQKHSTHDQHDEFMLKPKHIKVVQNAGRRSLSSACVDYPPNYRIL